MLSVELSERERRFCEEYIIDYNASRAAVAAGSPPEHGSQRGWELLQRPEVQEYLRYLKQEQSVRTKITADRVLEEIARIAFVDPRRLVKIDSEGKVHITPSDELTEAEAAAVMGLKSGKNGVEIKIADKLSALEKLGRHLALFTDVVDNRMTFTQMPDVKIGVGVDQTGQPQEVKALTFDVGSDPHAIKSS